MTKSFGGHRVLARSDDVFQDDTTYILRGASGAGKTSLLNLLARYSLPDEGEIVNPCGVGYLMQEELLFSDLTVHENLRVRALGLPGRQAGDAELRIDALLTEQAVEGLTHTAIRDLSGGERRRVEIAATLLGEPDLLLFDEPTANLDPENSLAVYQAIWNARAGRTVVIVTHEKDIGAVPTGTVQLWLHEGRLSREA